MIDGIWTGEWTSNVSNISVGVGVLVFRQGKICGGNDRFFLTGSYRVQESQVEGMVVGRHYAGDPVGVFGLVAPGQAESLHFNGRIEGDSIILDGHIESNPMLQLRGTLTRRAGADMV